MQPCGGLLYISTHPVCPEKIHLKQSHASSEVKLFARPAPSARRQLAQLLPWTGEENLGGTAGKVLRTHGALRRFNDFQEFGLKPP